MGWKDILFEKDPVKAVPTPSEFKPPGQTIPQQSYQLPPTPLPLEDSSKWAKFFQDKLAKEGAHPYLEFSSIVAAMGNSVPEPVKFTSVFSGLKNTGVTKPALLTSAQQTLKVLEDDVDKFTQQIAQKRQVEVEALQQRIKDNQTKIAQLQQEVADLTTKSMQADMAIQNSTAGYTTYSQQARTKIGQDIQSITNFIPDNG